MKSSRAGRAPGPPPLPADVRQVIYQVISDLAEAALWLPGRYAWEKDRAAATLLGLTGDLARAAGTVRAFPGYPPDWPGHSYAAAAGIAAARQHEPDLGAWLAAILALVTHEDEGQLAAILATALPSRPMTVPASWGRPVTGAPAQLPAPAARPLSRAHLQALDDAIAHRRARLAMPCPDCRPGTRCDEHACDENLVAAYHRMAQSAVAALHDGVA